MTEVHGEKKEEKNKKGIVEIQTLVFIHKHVQKLRFRYAQITYTSY